MATKWIITIKLTDLDNKYTIRELINDIKDKWLPTSFRLKLDHLEVNRSNHDN